MSATTSRVPTDVAARNTTGYTYVPYQPGYQGVPGPRDQRGIRYTYMILLYIVDDADTITQQLQAA